MVFLIFVVTLVILGFALYGLFSSVDSSSGSNQYDFTGYKNFNKKTSHKNKSSLFLSDNFYRDLDRGEYDDDPDILREEDPDMYGEFFDD